MSEEERRIESTTAMSDLMYMITTPDHRLSSSSACATPDDNNDAESSSEASTTNEDGEDDVDDPSTPPLSSPMAADDASPLITDANGNDSAINNNHHHHHDSSSTSTMKPSGGGRRSIGGSGHHGQHHSLLPNGKKTKGRVKIKMEFIDNKLRRYTTFSKRKTGIMKKAYELSTLTGTQVMLLVASETGHVYTFATKKLQPMITSDAGKALIQTCLNSPDSSDGPPHFGESTLSASFQMSEIATNSLLFASNTNGNGTSANQSPSAHRQSISNNNNNNNNNPHHSGGSKRSQKLNHQLQQQHCANAIQDVLAAAIQSRANAVSSGHTMDNGDLSVLNDLGMTNTKGSNKGSYYNASELPTMVPPNAGGSRFPSAETPTPNYFTHGGESGIGDDDEDADLENGDLLGLVGGAGGLTKKTCDPSEEAIKSVVVEPVAKINCNSSSKRRSMFQKHVSSPSSSSVSSTQANNNSSSTANLINTTTSPAGSTLNNILHNMLANRQQQRQQAATSGGGGQNVGNQQQTNRRKRPHGGGGGAGGGGSQSSANKQANIFGQTSASQQASNLGSQLFPFAGLLPNAAGMNGGGHGNQQQGGFGLFPGLGNGAFFLPPGFVYSQPNGGGIPEGAAAALALQQMLTSAMLNAGNGQHNDGARMAQSQSQMAAAMAAAAAAAAQNSNGGGGGRNNGSPASQSAQQSMIPLSLPLSMMTANFLASQQSRDLQGDDFDDGNAAQLDEDESD